MRADGCPVAVAQWQALTAQAMQGSMSAFSLSSILPQIILTSFSVFSFFIYTVSNQKLDGAKESSGIGRTF